MVKWMMVSSVGGVLSRFDKLKQNCVVYGIDVIANIRKKEGFGNVKEYRGLWLGSL